ncbi:S-adenosyl-L-methionine-dependent methyltransferase [Aspergillus aurantiobrunneus]
MARLLRSLRQFLGLTAQSSPSPSFLGPRSRFSRSIDTDFSYFREGDRALVILSRGQRSLLTSPLRRGHRTETPRGILDHDQIIGRRVRDQVTTRKGTNYRVILPTLAQYIALTPRHVTPIYARDASVIVSYLDIDVAPPGEGGDSPPPLEILESGTGHGSLTLQLARAIQAANTLPPPIPSKSQVKYLEDSPTWPDSNGKDASGRPENEPITENEDQTQQQWDAWRAQRRAVIHTVEVSSTFSNHAEKIVRGYRRGIYAGNVDFYVGRVENWIATQRRLRTPPSSPIICLGNTKPCEPFLTHAILDMPSAHLRITHIAPILKPNGILAVFMPSVTQIADCVDIIRKQRIPLDLDGVYELGTGLSGGRMWDVRSTTKKSKADPGWEESSETMAEKIQTQDAPKETEDVIVCRPMAGTIIQGGGFVGFWRKMLVPEATTL